MIPSKSVAIGDDAYARPCLESHIERLGRLDIRSPRPWLTWEERAKGVHRGAPIGPPEGSSLWSQSKVEESLSATRSMSLLFPVCQVSFLGSGNGTAILGRTTWEAVRYSEDRTAEVSAVSSAWKMSCELWWLNFVSPFAQSIDFVFDTYRRLLSSRTVEMYWVLWLTSIFETWNEDFYCIRWDILHSVR